MKDFIKWLGVNEKVAKVVVWLLIIMVMLIIFNTAMESLGFPNYAITYQNLFNIINVNKILNYGIVYVVTFLNFYSIVLLVFRIKESKRIFKYALLFILLSTLITLLFPKIVAQIFIPIYIFVFCYFYSNKKWKYVVYGVIAIIITTLVQGVWYMSKARFIDYSSLNYTTQSILSLDYFIIMIIIILVKEIYLKKRGEKKWEDQEHQHAGYGLENSRTKANSQRKSQKKYQAQLNSK